MLIPTEIQEKRIRQILDEPTQAALVANTMGTGKTLIGTEVIKRLAPTKPVLIVAPLGTFIGWEKTIKGQEIPLDVYRIDTKKTGKEHYEMLLNGKPGVYIIGHAMFRRKEWKRAKLSILIYDEVHDVSNRKSIGHRTLMTTKAEWRIAMSGTPSGNKFAGMWAVTRWLWPNLIDRSFWRWAARWCYVEFDPFAGKRVEGEREHGAFVKTLPCYFRDELTLDVDMQQEIRYVELTPAQSKIYDQMEEDMLMFLPDGGVTVAELPVAQRVRLRQVTLGVPYVKGMVEKTFITKQGKERRVVQDIDFKEDCKSSKIDALKEILAANEDENFLVLVGDFARFAKVVAARLGDDARLWSGDSSQDQREWMLENFGKEFRILVATVPSIGTGTDGLQDVCNNVVWLSQSENRLLNEQSAARLLRTGQTKDVRSWIIQAEGTYDAGVFRRLELQKVDMEASLNG
jgi:superfamily II DNA or RNA helicase